MSPLKSDEEVDDDVFWTFSNNMNSYSQQSRRKSAKHISLDIPSSSLFALIIGIDVYASTEVRNLQGAVADAQAVQNYLTNLLSVPKARIRNLRNSQATRAAIISELVSLTSNVAIGPDDPILIYFAGHGGQVVAPDDWAAGGADDKIEMLIPHDYRTPANDGQQTHGIPDRTIGRLLSRVARAKHDNVTVIFDCCHSGSGTREEDHTTAHLVRGFEIAHPIPAELDMHIWGFAELDPGEDRGSRIPQGFLRSGLRSHVLLTACGAKEEAKEEHGRGVFTKALLQLLTAINAETITYTDVLRRIHALPGQNPQCEGVNKDRILFKGKAPSRGRLIYRVLIDGTGSKYVLEAGAAHGIGKDAVFDLYPDQNVLRNAVPLASMIVTDTRAFTSTLEFVRQNSSLTLIDTAYAMQTRAGEEEHLRLCIEPNEGFASIYDCLCRDFSSSSPFGSVLRRVSLVSKDKAEYEISLEGNEVVTNILNPQVTQFGLHQLPKRIEAGYSEVSRLISSLAHYQKHLRRNNSIHALQKLVVIEVMKLQVNVDASDAFPVGKNLNLGGIVDMPIGPSGESDAYGIRILNHSQLDLYASLFYFDNSDLSIESYYEPSPPTSHIIDIPLPRASFDGIPGSLTLGYGSSGVQPYQFYLDEDEVLDVGFLKLFLTTTPVDFSHVAQSSPFVDDDERWDRGMWQRDNSDAQSLWDTMLVAVVQRRVL
ncbi:caspase domain-containing protein [Crassisporium funariophilum]|nr:caspase domain-containing protein [Crassisporium funariophilum]